jgi:hypothetical protein
MVNMADKPQAVRGAQNSNIANPVMVMYRIDHEDSPPVTENEVTGLALRSPGPR